MPNPKKHHKYEPPRSTTGDTSHLVTSAILSIVPGAAELFEYFVTPPLEKRRQMWMEEIGEAMRELEKNRGLNLEELQSNDVFIDTLLHASQIMARNSQMEKREALKNAVLNVALPHPPEQALIQMFLEWIDIFTVWHLKILNLIDNPEKWQKVSDDQQDKLDMDKLKEQWLKERDTPPSDIETGGFILFLETVYPELKGKKSFYLQIVRDLYIHGLISIEDLRNILWEGILTKRSTELGIQFLKFIEKPR